MKNGIYAVVKKYDTGNDDYKDWHFNPKEHALIFDKMMYITGNDTVISIEAASWCELATIGEIYEFKQGEIEIMEID